MSKKVRPTLLSSQSELIFRLQIILLYFAGVRTSLAAEGEPYSESISLPHAPFALSSLRSLLAGLHPGNDEFIRVLGRSLWSVNEEMVDKDDEATLLLDGGETVCPIPPVSGG